MTLLFNRNSTTNPTSECELIAFFHSMIGLVLKTLFITQRTSGKNMKTKEIDC